MIIFKQIQTILCRAIIWLPVLLPLYLVRFSIYKIPTNAFEVIVGVLAFYTLFEAIRNGTARNLLQLPRGSLFRTGLLLMFVGTIASMLVHPTLSALGIVKGWFFVPMVVFVLLRYAAQKVSIRWVLHAYALSAAALAVVALGYAARGLFTFDGRLAAFFESPNHLAMFIAPAILIAFANFQFSIFNFQINSKSQKTNPFRSGYWNFGYWGLFGAWCLMLGILIVVLYLTKSHGAMIALAAAGALGMLLSRVARRFGAAVIVLVVVFGALLPFVAVRYWPQWQQIFNIPERSSIASRSMIWRTALAIGGEYPVFGIGPGNFQEQYLRYQKNYPPYLEWAVPQPHNTYLAFWLQTGILGLVGFLLLLVWFFRASLAVSRWLPAAIMLYMLLHGAVDTLYWKNDLAVVFWMLLAVGASREGSLTDQDAAGDGVQFGIGDILHPPQGSQLAASQTPGMHELQSAGT